MQASSSPRHRLLLLALVAIAARAITFGNPVVHVDEEFYFVTAWRMWSGALPYIDVWDRKPIGLFLLYMPAAWLPLPWGTWAYQAMALGAVVATAWLIARLADRAGWAAGGTLGGVAYILWLDLLGGQSGQAPVFYNLLMVGAAMLIVRGGAWRGTAAMALVGLTLQIKYSAVIEGVFFGLWLMAAQWRRAPRVLPLLGHGAMLVAIALLPTIAVGAFYAVRGYWSAFAYANFLSIFARNANDLRELALNGGQMVLIASPVVAMAWGARRTHRGGDAGTRRFLYAWLVAAIVGLAVFRPWFDHYALPMLVPGCACAAGFLGAGHWRGRASAAILLLAALAGQIVLFVHQAERGTPRQFAALAAAVGKGPGCLYVYSGNTMLYVATERCALSRYVVPAHLGRTREANATGVDQDSEIRRILAHHPAVVVMRPPYTGERPEAHRLIQATMDRDYRLAARLPMGNEAIAVYRPR